eukprot:g16678.t1
MLADSAAPRKLVTMESPATLAQARRTRLGEICFPQRGGKWDTKGGAETSFVEIDGLRMVAHSPAPAMGTLTLPAKRIKVRTISKAGTPKPRKAKGITSLNKPRTDGSSPEVAVSNTQARMGFRCPVTIDTVFDAPTEAQVAQFYSTRCPGGALFSQLSQNEKKQWEESLRDNTTLMGFIVYSQLLPSLLKNRIKLNSATYHWSYLDPASERGRIKLEQRREAALRLNRADFTPSVFRGQPYGIDTSVDILSYMKMKVDAEDERSRFFTSREFSVMCSERGDVNGSSVFASSSTALSLMWFATVVLGRPCSLESVILPLSTAERQSLEHRFGCPTQFFDGPVRGFQTKWKDVFASIGVAHRNIDYTLLEKASEDRYIEGVHVSDAYAVYRATVSAPGDVKGIASLVESYKMHSKHGVDSGGVVGVMDVIRAKSVDSTGKIDGTVLGAIYATFGEEAGLKAQRACSNNPQGGMTLFDDSVSGKLGEVMAHFEQELRNARKKHKMERIVSANMDPAGLNKKIQAGKMLDPRDPKSIDLMHDMLKGLSAQVWSPLKRLIGEALGSSMEYPSAFLRLSSEDEETLYKHLVKSGVAYTDIANLCTLLFLSNSFQRSQVLRDSTVDEYVLVADGTHYRLVFQGRRFKSASSSGSSSAKPVSHFNLSSDQSMIVKFIFRVGHRFCKVQDMGDDTRRLFLNSKGESWTQKDIGTRFKLIGAQWLGIQNLCPHASRSFWATHALNTGQVSGTNVEDFSSFLQVSSATLRNSYMSSCAHTSAHTLGSEVLGSVVNAACTRSTTEEGAAPYGKKLNARRLEFLGQIRASLAK